jgi:hypothetical protein
MHSFGHREEDHIEIYPREMDCEDEYWIGTCCDNEEIFDFITTASQ